LFSFTLRLRLLGVGLPLLYPLFLLLLSRSFYLGCQLLLGLLSGVFPILIDLPQYLKVSSLGMIL
jgi:hypothetical protein